MKTSVAQQVFLTDTYNSVIMRGPVIVLYYLGVESIKSCQSVSKSIALEIGSTGFIYVSTNSNAALRQAGILFNPSDN